MPILRRPAPGEQVSVKQGVKIVNSLAKLSNKKETKKEQELPTAYGTSEDSSVPKQVRKPRQHIADLVSDDVLSEQAMAVSIREWMDTILELGKAEGSWTTTRPDIVKIKILQKLVEANLALAHCIKDTQAGKGVKTFHIGQNGNISGITGNLASVILSLLEVASAVDVDLPLAMLRIFNDRADRVDDEEPSIPEQTQEVEHSLPFLTEAEIENARYVLTAAEYE